MRSPTSPYEVRCPRCDVSFAVGTRQCMHCGGATGRLDRDAILESMMASSVADGVVDPFDVADDPFSSPMGDPDREHEPELHSSDDEPVATKRSPFRSIGQFFWVAALIGFALLRNCAED